MHYRMRTRIRMPRVMKKNNTFIHNYDQWRLALWKHPSVERHKGGVNSGFGGDLEEECSI